MINLTVAAIANGDPYAKQFLSAWGHYLRAVDDIVDHGTWDAEHLIAAFALGNIVYSCPFYIQHRDKLQMLILTGTALWEVSCEWEKRDELWQRQWADYLRHSDVAMISAVAMICRGWEYSTNFIRSFLAVAYVDHRDRHGLPDGTKPINHDKTPGTVLQD